MVDSVVSLADFLWEEAYFSEAATVLGQTVEVFRRIAAASTSKTLHAPHLSLLLRDYGRALEFTAKEHLASKIHEETLDIMGMLYSENPKSHGTAYADYVLSRDGWLHSLEREHDSLRVGKEVIRVLRDFYNDDSTRHASTLLLTLTYHTEATHTLSQSSSVLDTGQDPMSLAQKLYNIDPSASGCAYAVTIVRNHIIKEETWVGGCGWRATTDELKERARHQFDDVAKHRVHLANCLFSKASILHSTGQHVEGLSAIERALEIWRTLLAASPSSRFCSHFALSSHLRAIILLSMNLHAVAIDAMAQSLEMVTPLYHREPETYRKCYSVSLLEYADWLFRLEFYDDCTNVLDEAVPLGRRLWESDPSTFQPYVTATLRIQDLLSAQT